MEVTPSSRIRFGDLGLEVQEIRQEVDTAIARVLDRGWFVLGSEGEAFEKEFASWLGAADAAGCGNGTDAITLALKAIGVGPHDEVITVANTCVPTAAGIRDSGAELRVVDCDPDTLQISPSAVASAISSRTRAVVAVHLYGNPPDLDALSEICEARGVALIEDCAQAHGTSLRDRPAGTIGRISAWSFYPSKNIGAYGDGGAVVSNDTALTDAVRRLRNYGQRVRYYHDEEGRNSRLDELQAAILRVKLRHIDRWNEARRKLASLYEERFAGTAVFVPKLVSGATSSRHLFPVMVPDGRRDEIRDALAKEGIETLIHYPVPLHLQKAFSENIKTGALPVSESAARRLITLPLYPQLAQEDVARTAEALIRQVS